MESLYYKVLIITSHNYSLGKCDKENTYSRESQIILITKVNSTSIGVSIWQFDVILDCCINQAMDIPRIISCNIALLIL